MEPPPLRSVLIGEFFGTLLLILLGNGVVASVQLLDMQGNWIVITTGWGLAVTLGVYVSGRLSGGHINPAVTLALATRGEVSWDRLLPYWSAQLAGAFCGAALVYADYFAAFAAFEHTHHIVRGTLIDGKLPAAGGAGVFATYPAFDGLAGNFFSEFLGTALLLFGVRAVTDRRNASPQMNLEPILVGAVVWAIGLSLGGLTGYAINPARDLGPRLASAVFGWGPAVFQSHNYYFWVPIVGPLAGGIVGTALYDLAIHRHLPPVDEPSPPGRLSP
ncbi:MIP/aquaporin family protein [Singulisphaera acidiphila]|uniref:MIP family channel protein n=1 Tax=Singulisphaera acidiphila (strain ATCC BAA-1392 / DSM 18658 / VKM B-2454 / MOB10) TaxID=886293 RepID=L0DFD7_SINAD|nr:MIP family channel protein [Singulisphaera acidiphila]AGA27972.1 MIP family channel protein [Singulisphaera acidiphila DSM 18658]